MTQIPSLMDMLKAGMHFGHQGSKWHPKMKQYIFGMRGGVHIIDLERTTEELEKALVYAKNLAVNGKSILFVGIKRQAREITKAAAEDCGMPYLTERWIGGLLTNFDVAKQRLKKYNTLKQQIASGEIEKYTKKEQIEFKKTLEKMDKYLIGLAKVERLPEALFISDMRISKTAVAEAKRMNIPIIGVCDTNVNPENATYVIPANDDAVNSIKMISNLLASAIKEGKVDWEKSKAVMDKENIKKMPGRVEQANLAGKSSLVKAVAQKTATTTTRRAVTKESSV